MLNPTVMEVARELLALGLCPVPVVPKQCQGRTKLNGKTPSYFDKDGNPTYLKVNELGLHDRLPTQKEIEEWFADPRIGIGSYGSPDGKTCWIDFDAKRFESPEHCRKVVVRWRKKLGIKDSWVDRSGGGGYRVLGRFNEVPRFTNFSIKVDGSRHVGEILGRGKFCVLAPSLHESGNRYERIKTGGVGQLESPEKSYLYPAKLSENKEVVCHAEALKKDNLLSFENRWTDSDWARSYLSAISPDKADDYDQWVRIGMALRSVGDPNLLDDWIEFSKQSSKFKNGECEKKWGGFKPGQIELGTLHYFAINDGWVNPFKDGISSEGQRKRREEIQWENWKGSRKFTADIMINQQYFEFPELPKSDFIAAAKSGLGTGKTQGLISETKRHGKGTITIGCRNNLLHQTIHRFESAGITGCYHLQNDDAFGLLADKNSHIFLCVDSLKHLSPKYAEEKYIYVDETVAVLAHLVNGETLGSEQAFICEVFKQILQKCLGVYCLDGNLRDLDIDLIRKLSGKEVIKIDNKFKGEPHQITIIDAVDEDGKVKKQDRSPLIKMMMTKEITAFTATDSLERSKVLDRLFSEAGMSTILFNSETSPEPEMQNFRRMPSEEIQRKKPDRVTLTPSGEMGFDVHGNGHFSHKFAIFSGVLTTNSQTQMMFRLRDNLPQYIHCPEQGLNDDRNRPKSYSQKQFEAQSNNFILQSAELAASASNFSEIARERLLEAIGRSDDEYWQYCCLIGAIENYERNHLRKCLIYALEQAGHTVEDTAQALDDAWKAGEKTAKEEVQKEVATEIFTTPELSEEEAKSINKRGANNKDEQRALEKTYLLNRLPGIKDSEFWNPDFLLRNYVRDKHYLSRHERFFLLNNPEISARKNLVDWFFKSENEYFFKGMARKNTHSSVWALDKLGVTKFLEGEWHKESPELIKLVEDGRNAEIELALGIVPGRERPDGKQRIEYLKRLLELIGVGLKALGQQTIGNQRLRVYKAEGLGDPERLAVLQAIERRFTTWFNSDKAEVAWKSGMAEPAARSTPIYIQGGGCVQAAVESPAPTSGVGSGDFGTLHAGGEASELDEAIATFATCETFPDFVIAAAKYDVQTIDYAIDLQALAIRQRLRQWLAQMKEASSKQQIEVGSVVRVVNYPINPIASYVVGRTAIVKEVNPDSLVLWFEDWQKWFACPFNCVELAVPSVA